MRRRLGSLAFQLLLFVAVAVLAWPAFVGVATLAGMVQGEAWQLDAWTLEPKRRLVARFIEGWMASAPIALGVAGLAWLDQVLLARWRQTHLAAGLLFPLAGAVAAFALWPVPMDVLPTLAATGLVLGIAYRIALALRERFR